MHVTLCEYLVFHEFRCHLYITLAKHLQQEGGDLLFSSSSYTVFSSIEAIPWDESSRLLYDLLDMLFNASCLANLSDICDYFVQ